MRQETFSQEKPKHPFRIENVRNGKCTILFLDEIKKYKIIDEDGAESTNYKYYQYVMDNVPYRTNLEAIIQNDLEGWLNKAKTLDREVVANDIRKKRNTLLDESDKEMCIDRLGLPIPKGDTFEDWLPFLKQLSEKLSSPTANYRQELRDISKQKDFPYDVEWPKEV